MCLILCVGPSSCSSSSQIHPAIGAAFSALNILTEVRVRVSNDVDLNAFPEQACESQEKCKEAASDLTAELDHFLTIERKLEFLREREESRRAVERMMEVVTDAANYISSHTSTKILCSYFIHQVHLNYKLTGLQPTCSQRATAKRSTC